VNPDPGPGEAGEEKKYSRKLFSSLFDKKIAFQLCLSKLPEKPSDTQRDHPALQKI
jgi:hypothetical protein